MGIKDLSGHGSNFRVSTGAGNLTKQLHHETLRGELGNLRDNQANVLKVIKKFEQPIRLGTFSRLRQLSAYREIKKLEGANLSYGDKKDVKKLLKHLSEEPKATGSEPKKAPIINRAEDPNSLTKQGSSGIIHRADRLNTKGDSPSAGIFQRGNKALPQSSIFNRSNNTPSNSLEPYAGHDPAARAHAARANLDSHYMSQLDKGNNAGKLSKSSFKNLNNLY